MFGFPKFTCSSGLTQGRAGGSDLQAPCRDRADHCGWAEMVPPRQVKSSRVMQAAHRVSPQAILLSSDPIK